MVVVAVVVVEAEVVAKRVIVAGMICGEDTRR